MPPTKKSSTTKESEEKEEEYLIYIDFKQFLPFDELIDPDTQIKIIGLDSEHPIAQVNGRFFQGDYEFATGTKMFFTESLEPPPKNEWDLDSDSKVIPFDYVAKTNKVLKMNRIFISSKSEPSQVKPELEQENTSRYEVSTTYSEVLSRFLPVGMEPPRMISEEENGLDLMKRSIGEEATDDDESIEETEPNEKMDD